MDIPGKLEANYPFYSGTASLYRGKYMDISREEYMDIAHYGRGNPQRNTGI